jgi:peptidoglycan/xylan/chitin deacetylase (PgdA/CDA1 family)
VTNTVSPPPTPPDHGPSPPGVVVLTFDNLGEAGELERGDAADARPPGAHPSVTVALPRLLRELSALGLTATFFVEAINCELNPAALDDIAAAGHELGVHGWRHERWIGLGAARERALLTRAGAAFAGRGLTAEAFRPPGGELTAHTPSLLRELGYRWCSPAGTGAVTGDGFGVVPFDWGLVDAYHLMESFAPLRAQRGDPVLPTPPGVVADRLIAGLTAPGAVHTVILHPFLMLDDGWWEGTRRVLAALAKLGRDRVMPGGRLMAQMAPGAPGAGVVSPP